MSVRCEADAARVRSLCSTPISKFLSAYFGMLVSQKALSVAEHIIASENGDIEKVWKTYELWQLATRKTERNSYADVTELLTMRLGMEALEEFVSSPDRGIDVWGGIRDGAESGMAV